MGKYLEDKFSLGWLFFWLIFIPPIGYIWLFITWLSWDKCIVKRGKK